MISTKLKRLFILMCMASLLGVCRNKQASDNGPQPPGPPPAKEIEYWLTQANKTSLLERQLEKPLFNSPSNNFPFIDVDSATSMQTVYGFGFTLTGGSAYVINHMDPAARTALLNELFGTTGNSISISYLRLSIGASDLNASVFSYNDMPLGQTDLTLSHFSLSQDTIDLIPVLSQIMAINPNIKLMGSPWSAPVWMKDNGSTIGGSLQPQFYSVYAQYFVRYIQEMLTRGFAIDAVTPQNEPQHGGNNPSMLMSAIQQADFIKNHLGPAFQSAGINTKIVIWDHNADNPNFPITVLNDAGAKQFIHGSAFHLYAGDISALSTVRNAHPDRELYFTEQWTGANSSFDADLLWLTKNVIIGSMRNWSRIALLWNLAADPMWRPHTPGGCTECKGGVTVDGSSVTRNVGYYTIGQVSKFIPPGSVRIVSNNNVTGAYNVAFKRPDGKKVLVVLNEGNSAVSFNIRYKGSWSKTGLPAGSVATYIW